MMGMESGESFFCPTYFTAFLSGRITVGCLDIIFGFLE